MLTAKTALAGRLQDGEDSLPAAVINGDVASWFIHKTICHLLCFTSFLHSYIIVNFTSVCIMGNRNCNGTRKLNSTDRCCLNKANGEGTKPDSKIIKRAIPLDNAKKLPGAHQTHILLERLVVDFWKTVPKVTVLDELLNDGNERMVGKLHKCLLGTAKQIKNCSDKEGVPLIPGGGKFLIKLQPAHLPRLQRLTAYVFEAYRAAKIMAKLGETGFL